MSTDHDRELIELIVLACSKLNSDQFKEVVTRIMGLPVASTNPDSSPATGEPIPTMMFPYYGMNPYF